MTIRRVLGRSFLALYALQRRVRAKCFSVAGAGGFASFGAGTVIETPVRIEGAQRIVIGKDVFVGAGSWLQSVDDGAEPSLFVGDGVRIAGMCVLSAAREIRVGDSVLMARNVYIADHNHAFSNLGTPIVDQGITDPEPVVIGQGVWLGENVVVTAGVTIGRGSVIGANSVVNQDVPEYSIAVGAPARVVRSLVEPPPDAH